MKHLLAIVITIASLLTNGWGTNIEEAKKLAKEQNKFILLNFSGSDWCIPCIKMKKDIFEKPTFQSIAENKLVLVNADFPRNKKNQLSADLTKSNEALAETYNTKGKFPLTLLLNSEGKIIYAWEGYPSGGEEIFIQHLKEKVNENLQ